MLILTWVSYGREVTAGPAHAALKRGLALRQAGELQTVGGCQFSGLLVHLGHFGKRFWLSGSAQMAKAGFDPRPFWFGTGRMVARWSALAF